MVLSPALADTVDLQSVLIRAQPFTDKEELLPLCYRCQTTNPMVNTQVRGKEAIRKELYVIL
jgi:intraflagellar transport protein 122